VYYHLWLYILGSDNLRLRQLEAVSVVLVFDEGADLEVFASPWVKEHSSLLRQKREKASDCFLVVLFEKS